MNPSQYFATELLRDGREIEIRALRPSDRDAMLTAVGEASAQSLYRRFFGPRRGFTDKEIDFFVNVDFQSHVALVAALKEDGQQKIAGGGRYIVVKPGQAELAFVVLDKHQGLGIGKLLMKHLVAIARDSAIGELTADVLSENTAMLKVFERSGLPFATTRDGGTVHVVLALV